MLPSLLGSLQLCRVLCSMVQERHWHTIACQEEGYQNLYGAEAFNIYKEKQKTAFVHP